MNTNTAKVLRVLGLAGALLCVVLFIRRPSFPTPDKLFIFLLFSFMAFGQARQMFQRLFPFVAVILVYEIFQKRGR